MSTLFPCRVVQDRARSGEQNMAIDGEMLTAAVAGQATVRTYSWEEPTVSLGHFQAHNAGDVPQRFQSLPVVKRLSGGGAILHDRELTYSIALPKGHPILVRPTDLYELAHEVIIDLLRPLGIESRMRGDEAFADQPFLCFLRGDARDVVIGKDKIVGSAQRRRQGAVLQHGSLLLARSDHAPELPGIRELTGVEIDAAAFAQQFLTKFCEELRLIPVDHNE